MEHSAKALPSRRTLLAVGGAALGVRAAFVPRGHDWVLLSADYSQIELRLLAHLSGDKALIEAFQSGEDIHARTAAIVHGLLPAMVTPELRNQAKIVNYGLMYGMGASRLARETGMRPPEAPTCITTGTSASAASA